MMIETLKKEPKVPAQAKRTTLKKKVLLNIFKIIIIHIKKRESAGDGFE